MSVKPSEGSLSKQSSLDSNRITMKYEDILSLELKKFNKVLRGHAETVTSLALTPDNKYIVSGSQDYSVKVWSVHTLEEEFTLLGHTSSITSLAVTPDGKQIISGSEDQTIKIWNIFERKLEITLIGHSTPINSISLSPSGIYLTSASNDPSIKVWNLLEKKEEFTLQGTENFMQAILSPDQTQIYSRSQEHVIQVWNFQERAVEYTKKWDSWEINSCILTPDGKFVVVENREVMRLWNIQKKVEEYVIKSTGLNDLHSAILFDNGNMLVCANRFSEVFVYDLLKLQEKLTFIGHTEEVNALAISASEDYIISGSEDKTIRIWNFSEKREQKTYYGHSNYVSTISLIENDFYLLSGSNDDTVKLWDLTKGEVTNTLKGHKKMVTCMAFSRSNNVFVTGSNDSTLIIWNLQTFQINTLLQGHTNEVTCIGITPDSKTIISGSKDKTLRFWSVSEKKEISCITSRNNIDALVICPNGKHLAYASSHSIVIFNLADMKNSGYLNGHKNDVKALAVSSDGKFIASGSTDRSVKFWDWESRSEDLVYTFVGHQKEVLCVCISEKNNFIVSGGEDAMVILWDINAKRRICTFSGHKSEIYTVVMSKNESFIMSGSMDYTIKQWSISKSMKESYYREHHEDVNALAISPDGNFVVSGSKDSKVVIWNVKSHKKEWSFNCIGYVNSLAISPNGKYLLCGNADLTYWDLEAQKNICILDDPPNNVWIFSVAISPNGKFAIAAYSKTVKCYDLSELKIEFTLEGHLKDVKSVAFSAKGDYIVSGSEDKTIKVWSFDKRKEVFSLIGHTDTINSVAVDNNWEFIVSGSKDAKVVMWDIKSQRQEHWFQHGESVNSVVISTDTKYIVTGSTDRTVKVWNSREKRIEFTLIGHSWAVKSVIISPDNTYILSGSTDSTVMKWKTFQSPPKADSLPCLHLENTDGKDFSQSFGISPTLTQTITTEDFKYSLQSNYFSITDITENDYTSHTCISSFWTPCNEYDMFHNEPLSFYNITEVLATKNFKQLAITSSQAIFSKFAYSIVHVLSYLGQKEILESVTKSKTFFLKADNLGKSPIYYSIMKKYQDCTDVLLEFMINLCLDPASNSRCRTSLFAIRGEFGMIIKNSSRHLPEFLSSLLLVSSSQFAKVPYKLPRFHDDLPGSTPLAIDFEGKKSKTTEEIPIKLLATPFPIIGTQGCSSNIDLLNSISSCRNIQIFQIPIIQYFIDLQWNNLKLWVFLYTFLLFSNLAVIMVIICLENTEIYLLVLFFIVFFLLLTWEIIQFIVNRREYFKDFWNYIDLTMFVITFIWIILEINHEKSLYLRWFVGLLSFIRGITGFRLFDGTRFYIELIIRSLNDIKYFLIMWFYSTLAFGFLFMISRNNSASFDTIWLQNYALNFGTYYDTLPQDAEFTMNYIVYFAATILNVVLMLNLLISILGDSYDKFQIEQVSIDYKEKTFNALEIQKMLFWSQKHSKLRFIHVCAMLYENEEIENWGGKINFIDKNIKEITLGQGKITEKISNISSKILNIEEKIGFVESSLTGKISAIESKIESLDLKLEKIIQKLSQ